MATIFRGQGRVIPSPVPKKYLTKVADHLFLAPDSPLLVGEVLSENPKNLKRGVMF